MHNIAECCKFDKEGKQLVKPTKPFDSAKKPCAVPTTSMCRLFGQSHMWLVCTGVLTIL